MNSNSRSDRQILVMKRGGGNAKERQRQLPAIYERIYECKEAGINRDCNGRGERT